MVLLPLVPQEPPESGTNLTNQVILISGDRITDVGPAESVKVPAGARVIDLSQATALPGLIDAHVHLTDSAGGLQHQMMVAVYSTTQSLKAGFTTLVVMGTHGGGYGDVELKKAIESGLVQGPRRSRLVQSLRSPPRVTAPPRWNSSHSNRR